MARRIPVKTLPAKLRSVTLPSKVDNSLNKYFPWLVSQTGFSCQQVAGISYCYAYELNRLRDVSSAEWNNTYPALYTWNYMNNGEQYKGVSFFYSWDVIKRQGQPDGQAYPADLDMLGWMSGYDRYYAGMKNRLKQVSSIPVNTEEGILTLKHYLYNHLDGSSTGGIVVFGASGMLMANKDTIPLGSPEAGKHIFTGFYPVATHGMTIVGYNDSIRVDLNGDGQYTNNLDINGDGVINPKDWEWGAYRMADSYGTWFEDNGFCWIMYRALALDYDESLPSWDPTCGAWNESVFVVEPIADYTPLLTMKVSLNHSLRNTVSVKAGISANPMSQVPEYIQEFPIWNYQGNSYPANVQHPELPEMELGFDITPLLSYAEPGKPCRLFFILDEDDPYKAGNGRVNSVSFISYQDGTTTFPAEATMVPIADNASTLLSAPFTPQFDKVSVSNAELPAFTPSQPYSVQLQAVGGKPPYSWTLLHSFQKTSTDSVFPSIDQQELTPSNFLIPYDPVVLPFSFPFYGKKYDTVYVNAYGFISFTNDELPYHYLVDQEELLRNNILLAPLFSMKYTILPPDGKMWYESGPGWAGFRWSTKISGYESVSALNFALRLYSDGRFEFFYGDCHNDFKPEKTFSGHSAGDDRDFKVWTNWNLDELKGKSFLFDPVMLPASAALSAEGMLTVAQTEEDQIYEMTVRVTDACNISSTRKFSLSGQLDIEASLVTTDGDHLEKGKPAAVSLTLKNKGTQELTGISLVMKAVQDKIIFSDSTEEVAVLNAGEVTSITNAFSLQADSSFADLTQVPFIISAGSGTRKWQKNIFFPFSSPVIRVSKPVIHDGVNASLDPGEVADLLLTVSNEGSSGMKPLEITLSTTDSLIKILSPAVMTVDSLAAYDTLSLKYLVEASRFAGMGDTVPMMITVRDSGTWVKQFPFYLTTGKFPVAILNLSTDFASSSWMSLELDELGIKRQIYNSLPYHLGDHIVLFTNMGFQPEDSLDIPEQNILDSYLLAGGNIYLEQNKGWQKASSGFFSRFHVISDSVPANEFQRVNGEDGTFAQSMHFSYSGYHSAAFDLLPVNPSYSILTSPEARPLQVAYDGSDYKTIGSMIAFGSLSDSTDPSNKKTLMRKYLDFFGIDPQGTKAFFHTDRTTVSKGETIQFTDDSFEGITQWQWDFPGGNPASSAEQNPVVEYPQAGIFNATLTVTDNTGSATIRKKDFIRVNNITGISPEHFTFNDFIIYPNPAGETVTIENRGTVRGNLNLDIFDMQGMKKPVLKVTSRKMRLNLGNFTPGIYLFIINDHHYSQKIKVIVR